MRARPAPTPPTPDALAAASTFRIGRRRVLATGAEALGRWAIQIGILPRAEGGTQRPPAERLAALMADPACALPLAALDPATLVALRERRLAALGSQDAMLVEQAALAAAIATLCEVHGLHWPHPMAAVAGDGVSLLDAGSLEVLRRRTGADALDLALACGARFAEMETASVTTDDDGAAWIVLPGRWVQAPPRPGPSLRSASGAGFRALAAAQGLEETPLRLTALAGRLGRGSHLDEAFLMVGCGTDRTTAIRIPWLG